MQDVVIVEAVRTAVGRYLGALKDVEAYDLAAQVLNALVARSGVAPERVDQVILGQSYQNGEYVHMARLGLLTAGWPEAVPGTTIDSRCCTGLDVVRLAAAQGLRAIGTDEAMEALMASARQPDARVRREVVQGVAGFYRFQW